MLSRYPMTNSLFVVSIVLVVGLLLVACGSPAATSTTAPAPTTESMEQPTATTEAMDEPTPTTESMEEPTPTTEAMDEPTPTTESMEEPTPTTEAMEEPTPTTEAMDEPTPTTEAMMELPGEGTTVRMALPTWSSEYVAGEIIKLGLEDLGYTVEEVGDRALGNPAIFTSISQEGDIDVFPNAWWPLHESQVAAAPNPDQIVLAGTWAQAGALQGFLIDKATADAYEITSLEDFNDREISALFDRDDDGVADMVGCPPGWGCYENINFLWEQYDLSDSISVIEADYTPAMADTLARYQAGEPIFFYTWTPNWTVYALRPGEDVVWIEVPEPVEQSLTEAELEAGFTAEDAETEGVTGCVDDPCAMGFLGNDLGILANQSFLEENPAAAKLFEIVQIPLPFVFQQNNLMFEDGEDSPEDILGHAQEWVEENQDLWDGWLDEAVQAAG